MRMGDVFKGGGFSLSFEIFPPKTEKGDETLDRTLSRLSVYEPAFISCTYGAGGTTRNRTLDWCERVQQKYKKTSTAHFTCVGSSQAELLEWLGVAHGKGIHNIMALRGDPPKGETTFKTPEGGFNHAHQLVSLIREHFPKMGIGVAGYPEKHPEAKDLQTDLQHLKRKVECGADAVFTQLFYDNESFFRFKELYEKAGIRVPLVPGIMPITEFSRIQRITSMCGSHLPKKLFAQLEKAQDDAAAQFEIGVQHAVEQCEDLMENEVRGLHFYVLNQSQACERILRGLNLDPPKQETA